MAGRAVVLGTRGSPLALAQTEEVLQLLRNAHPDRAFRTRVIKTTGDVAAQVPLDTIGRGAFSSELEQALLAREIDVAVHSLKDLPGQLFDGLAIAATPERADPRDVLVSRDDLTLERLPPGALVGTSSPRRAALVREARPDLRTDPVRGNVDTRLRKLVAGQYSALILAAAGLSRLGLLERVTEFLDPERFVPAIGQGILGVEARDDDPEVLGLLRPLDHESTRVAAEAERGFLQRVGGGCKVPVAAYATIHGNVVRIRGLVASPDGTRVYRRVLDAPARQAGEVGARLWQALESAGASDLLARQETA
ncbi:MAG: hydroxymethylbilane synthase [Dehalococcoidia bacterium]|nr:hydroxymethylbilane synthase [Dehalococcoidia bacterium]